MIPYPLSTGPNCGDPMYFNFRCDNSISSRVTFKASSGEYRVIRIDPTNSTFVIQVQKFDNCEVRNFKSDILLPKLPSPFSIRNRYSAELSPRDCDVEINWTPPLEPTCSSQASCKEWPNSTCSNTTSDGKKRCLCNTNFKWDGVSLNCTGEQGEIQHYFLRVYSEYVTSNEDFLLIKIQVFFKTILSTVSAFSLLKISILQS